METMSLGVLAVFAIAALYDLVKVLRNRSPRSWSLLISPTAGIAVLVFIAQVGIQVYSPWAVALWWVAGTFGAAAIGVGVARLVETTRRPS